MIPLFPSFSITSSSEKYDGSSLEKNWTSSYCLCLPGLVISCLDCSHLLPGLFLPLPYYSWRDLHTETRELYQKKWIRSYYTPLLKFLQCLSIMLRKKVQTYCCGLWDLPSSGFQSSELTSDYSPLLILLQWCWPPYQFLNMLSLFPSEGLCICQEYPSSRNSHDSWPLLQFMSPLKCHTSFSDYSLKEALISFCPLFLFDFVHKILLFDTLIHFLFVFLSSAFEYKSCVGKNLVSFIHCYILSAQNSAWLFRNEWVCKFHCLLISFRLLLAGFVFLRLKL